MLVYEEQYISSTDYVELKPYELFKFLILSIRISSYSTAYHISFLNSSTYYFDRIFGYDVGMFFKVIVT